MKIEILYEDNHLLVVEKPVNVPVQRDSSKDDNLLDMLKRDLKVRYHKPGNVYLGLVHRLDRPVGGAMVFAKTSKAASRLSDALRRRTLDRTYLAVVRGTPSPECGMLEHYLIKDNRRNQVSSVAATVSGAKKAILQYRLLAKAKGLSLLEIELYTGRPHQIRVQLATVGCPLYGDQKYGQKLNQPGQQIALWAHSLEFDHPTKREAVKVKSSPPNEYPWSLFYENSYNKT